MNIPKKYLYYSLIFIAVLATSYYFMDNKITGGSHAYSSAALDDSWIHYVYAKNFADYGLFYYNYGQLEAGSTSPLWVVLLSIPLKLGFEPVVPSKIIGIILDFFMLVFVFKTLKLLVKNDYAALGVPLLLSLNPYLVYFRVSGMEVSLFALLSVTSVYYFFKKNYKITGVLLGLSILARPEGYVLLGVLFILSLFELKKKKLVFFLRKKILIMLLLAVLVSAPWNIFTLAVTGNPLPNTFYIKSRDGFSFSSSFSAITSTIRSVHAGSKLFNLDVSLIFNLFFFYLIIIGLIESVKNKNPDITKVIILSLLVIALMSLVIDYNFLGRYYDPLIPLLIISACMPLMSSTKWVKVSTIIILCLFGLNYLMNLQNFSNLYAISCMNIYDLHEAMGKYVRDYIPEDAVVSTPDAGAIKYYVSNYVCDVMGLNAHEPCNMSEVDYRIDWPAYGDPYENISEVVYTVTTNPNIVAASNTLTLYKLNWP